MKKRLWRLHSWLGLLAGLGLLVIGVTGSLLVFREQLDLALSPAQMRVTPTAQGPLSWETLWRAAQKGWPGYHIQGFGPRRSPEVAYLVYMKAAGSNEFRGGTLNQYTGEVLSGPLQPEKTFTGVLLELHYTWFADHVGMLVTGCFAVVLCLLGITGVYLYRDFWRNFFTLRWRQSGRIFFSDTHKMVGISSVVFNLILGFTGAYWNISHVAREGLGHVEPAAGAPAPPQMPSAFSLDAAVAQATQVLPGFRTHWVSFPGEPKENLTLWGQMPATHPFSGLYGSQVFFSPESGAQAGVNNLREGGWWGKVTDTFMPLHYGTFGGWPVKILWSVFGLAPGILAVSGFLIWRSRQRRRSPAMGTSAAPAQPLSVADVT